MTNKIIWTSKLTEERVKKEWEDRRKRCSWADLGSFEDNEEEAMDMARSRNDEELLWISGDFGASHVAEGDQIEIFKEGRSVFSFEAGGVLVPDIFETLFACVEHVSVYEQDATLRMEDGKLWIDVDWEDWLTKEKGTYHYTIKINGRPVQL